LASQLARKMGMDEAQSKIMERGAILHDIGKIGISDSILLKPGPLTPQEWHIMHQHPDIGARIIEGIPFLQEAMPVIRYHQERWDGSGYPIGLKGTEIPLMARIFAVVDAYDALTTDRPYRQKMNAQDALMYLGEQAGIHFDPDVVFHFQRMIRDNMAIEMT
jgi:putative nucleotidyltransferase with HDIG domain